MAEHKVFKIKNLTELKEEIDSLNINIPVKEDVSILLEKVKVGVHHILPNRFVVQPMEGFDADSNGTPGELAFRRYKRYGAGGSGLIWFEACAVTPGSRTNPCQFYIHKGNVKDYKDLVAGTREESRNSLGHDHNPMVILQLTHSGRYSKPGGKYKPVIAHHSPILDPLQNLPGDYPLITDNQLDGLQDAFVDAAKLAAGAGFDGVDIKSCHRYLASELFASYTRKDSRYGGSFENRIRFLKEVMQRITEEVPGLLVTTRMNAYDAIPYPYGFGMADDGSLGYDLAEPLRLVGELIKGGMKLLNISIGNPYYVPHFGRPYNVTVRGGKLPDMHPLENIALALEITANIQKQYPALPIVGSCYSWLQKFIPNVGAAVVDKGWAGLIGQGRNAFAYPDSVRDLMNTGRFDSRKVCTACSRCTQIMRDGGRTGCVLRDKEIYGREYRNARARASETRD